jgi:hypothetical protein
LFFLVTLVTSVIKIVLSKVYIRFVLKASKEDGKDSSHIHFVISVMKDSNKIRIHLKGLEEFYNILQMTNCYNNGIIYKLCCKDTTIKDIYVGSTCAFRMRKANHKSNCNNENSKKYNYYVYKFIRDHGGWDNWDMVEIKQFNCETKRELDKEERAVLEILGGTLNKKVPSRSKVEYYQKKKEEIKEKQKAHYERNKKEICEKQKEKFNCECGSILRKADKSQHIKSNKHQKFLNSSFA